VSNKEPVLLFVRERHPERRYAATW
jgi:hypothetical protein